MELIWFGAGVLVLTWLALAVVCVRKGRAGSIAVAIFLPVPVAIVTGIAAVFLLSVIMVGPEGTTDSWQREVEFLGAIYLVAAIAIGTAVLSSYLVLAVGAIRPKPEPEALKPRRQAITEQLKELNALQDSGTISDEEYDAQRAKILRRN